MSWKFGSIDFDAFGIRVARSQGILDLPSLDIEGTDWLDMDGKEYWQQDTRYDDRDIILNCWISGVSTELESGYEVFRQKVKDFTEALLLQGKETLETPYVDIAGCSISSGIALIRETNYVQDLQIGTFTLRITVHGDTKYQSVAVYEYTPPWGIKDYLVTNNLQVNRTLQGDSYATCSVETNRLMDINMYDYILINTNGILNEPYYFMAKPDVRKNASNKFAYNMRLDHGSVLLKQSQFLFDGESEFDIFADLDTIIDLVKTNADRFIAGKFVKGTIANTVRKNHTFKSEDCMSVVRRMAQEYGLEFDLKYTSPGTLYTINVVEQIATTKAVTLEYGRGNGLYELSRMPINRDNLVTVMYAYGAAKNLKPDYRSGKRRLEFDGNPLRQNDNLYMGVEKTVFFDDIYPNRTAQITGYFQKLPADLSVDEREVWPGGIYRIEDNTLDFDINDFLLGGLTAKIRMKTGALAGYEFEIQKYDDDYAYIWIIPFKDETGYVLPNATMKPATGDEYTLVDIDQPGNYVGVAEAELLATAQEYLDKWSVPEYPYQCRVHPGFLAGISDRFEVGDRITVKDSDFGIDRLYRISQFVYHRHTGVYDLTLSEHRILTRRERQQIAMERITRTMDATNSDTVEVIRKDQMTVGELSGILLDPHLEKLKTDNLVRRESIDPIHLGYDTGVPMFSIENGFFEANFGGDYDTLKVDPGKIVIQNWNALPRYEIDKLKKASLEYDPTRAWTFESQELTVPDDDGYWIYALLPIDESETGCSFEFQKTHVEVKQDLYDGYLTYKLGYVTPKASPRYLGMLWGNVKHKSSDKLYIAFASDDQGSDLSFVPGAGLDYVAFLASEKAQGDLSSSDFAGKWVKYVGEPGTPGADGREVELSVVGDYIVWRYVGDITWINLVALATITGADGAPGAPGSSVELRENAGWVEWRQVGTETWLQLFEIPSDGEPGTPGSSVELRENAGWVEWRQVGTETWLQLYLIPEGGGGGDTFVVHVKFDAAGTETYTCPYALKFTAMKYSQATAPSLSVALNTNMAEYDDLGITAQIGLVTLTGEWL